MKFNGDFKEINWRDAMWAAIIFAQIVWGIAIMPGQIIADCNTRFSSKERVDLLAEGQSRIESKLDRLILEFKMR